MSALAAALAPSLRLRVAVLAADPATAAQLADLVTRSGHTTVALTEPAEAAVSDGSRPASRDLPVVAIGPIEGDYAGFLPADAGPAQFDAALRAVAAGLTVRPLAPSQPAFTALPEALSQPLTPREVEVLTALADGLANKAVARRLGISPYTVKFHLESLFRKLGAASRAEAVAKGLRQQIVEF